MDVKEAAKLAKDYIANLFADEGITQYWAGRDSAKKS